MYDSAGKEIFTESVMKFVSSFFMFVIFLHFVIKRNIYMNCCKKMYCLR